MTPTERRKLATAYHEAGHAVMCWYLGIHIRNATIVPNEDSLGHVLHSSVKVRDGELVSSLLRVENLTRVTLAGDIVQRIHRKQSVRKYHPASDNRWAVELAMHVNGSSETATAWLRWLHLGTVGTVKLLWPEVTAVADALMHKKLLTGREIRKICVDARLPNAAKQFVRIEPNDNV